MFGFMQYCQQYHLGAIFEQANKADSCTAHNVLTTPNSHMWLQVSSKDIHLGVLPFKPAAKTSATSAKDLLVDPHDMQAPLLMALGILALAFFKRDAVADILQLDAGSSAGSSRKQAAAANGGDGSSGNGDAQAEWLQESTAPRRRTADRSSNTTGIRQRA